MFDKSRLCDMLKQPTVFLKTIFAYENHLLICEAWITNQNGKLIEVEGIIKDRETKKTIAKAQGQFVEIDLKKFLKN